MNMTTINAGLDTAGKVVGIAAFGAITAYFGIAAWRAFSPKQKEEKAREYCVKFGVDKETMENFIAAAKNA